MSITNDTQQNVITLSLALSIIIELADRIVKDKRQSHLFILCVLY